MSGRALALILSTYTADFFSASAMPVAQAVTTCQSRESPTGAFMAFIIIFSA